MVDVALQVDLVSDQHHLGPFGLGEAQRVPLVDEVVERSWAGLIEYQHHAVAPFEVGGHDSSVPFLPSGVPDVEFNELVLDSDILHLEVDGGDLGLLDGEILALGILPEEGGLSDVRVADDDELEALLLSERQKPIVHECSKYINSWWVEQP